MKRYWLRKEDVPESLLNDVRKLQDSVFQLLHTYISKEDMYEVWSKFSDELDAGWLDPSFCYEGYTEEENLQYILEKYGKIV